MLCLWQLTHFLLFFVRLQNFEFMKHEYEGGIKHCRERKRTTWVNKFMDCLKVSFHYLLLLYVHNIKKRHQEIDIFSFFSSLIDRRYFYDMNEKKEKNEKKKSFNKEMIAQLGKIYLKWCGYWINSHLLTVGKRWRREINEERCNKEWHQLKQWNLIGFNEMLSRFMHTTPYFSCTLMCDIFHF